MNFSLSFDVAKFVSPSSPRPVFFILISVDDCPFVLGTADLRCNLFPKEEGGNCSYLVLRQKYGEKNLF